MNERSSWLVKRSYAGTYTGRSETHCGVKEGIRKGGELFYRRQSGSTKLPKQVRREETSLVCEKSLKGSQHGKKP